MVKWCRAAFACLQFGFLFLTCVSANALSSPLWFANDTQLFQLAPDIAQVTPTLTFPGVKAIAADPERSSIWVLTGQILHRVDSRGTLAASYDLGGLGVNEVTQMQLDPYDGTLWVAGGPVLEHLDVTGRMLATWRDPSEIKAFAPALDQTLWMATPDRIQRLTGAGAVLASQTLPVSLVGGAKHLVVDSLGGQLWVASDRQLLRYSMGKLLLPAQSIGFDADISALALHPATGELWVASKSQLNRLDRAGMLLGKASASALGMTEINALAFDPTRGAFWLAGERTLLTLAPGGSITARYALGTRVERLGVASFKVQPTLALIRPPQDALTNNPLPQFTLQYGADCAGAPCDPVGYLRGFTLAASLNGQSVAPNFSFDPATGQSIYTPTSRLAEGANTFTASVLDAFAHSSVPIENRFTIDTFSPQFTRLLPADGLTVATPTLLISGQVDDPSASVVLENLANWNGQGANPATQNFSYFVTLKPGLNVFNLTAIDRAGNTAARQLRVNYASVSVSLASPSNGAAVPGDTSLVSGAFQGPPNTGITVNGVLAATDGSRFYASVPLLPGSNTLTVTATAPEGGTATQSITVTGGGSLPFSVSASPQEGIGPLAVSFRVGASGAATVQSVAMDADGDGAVDQSSSDPNVSLAYTYAVPGLYLAKVTVTDAAGNAYPFVLPVRVRTYQDMDGMLRGVYYGMLEKLRLQNVPGALTAVTAGVYKKYEAIFQALQSNLPAIVPALGDLAVGTIGSDFAEYVLVRGSGDAAQSFLIYFLRGDDGVWRIDGM